MTMLDRMRRHKGWLKWSLGLVVAAFILLYIPSFLNNRNAASSDEVATVNGQAISANEFRRTYQGQMQMYRSSYGNISDRMLKQLGIDQQILQQMVEERVEMIEAGKRGISVTDDEVAQYIMSMPAFQENGQFIGEARTRQMLSLRRPPIMIDEFEDQVRRSLVRDKLQSALTGWLTVSEDEIHQEFVRRNEKVKLEMVSLLADKFRNQVQVSDADVAAYFAAHTADYRIGEKRKVHYVVIDAEAMRGGVTVTSRDAERYYTDNIETYSTPEQVRASHILLKTGAGKDEAAVKAKAEALLKQVKSGADFAELARKNSEDEGSAKNGGDLDYFQRGKMVPEFDEVAFSLAPGQVSDLVKTQYGFHIIKVVDKKPATTKTFDEVKQQILEQLVYEKAQAKADDVADKMGTQVKSPADLDKAAAANGLRTQDSAFVTREEPIMAMGAGADVSAEIFGLKDGAVAGPLRTQRGWVLMSLAGKEQPHQAKLEEVKERVREDLTKQKVQEIATQKAQQLVDATKGGDLQKAAKAAGLEVKTTELVARESALPDIGISPQVDAVAFAMTAGAISAPIKTDTAVVVVKVVEKKAVTPEEYAGAKAKTREDLLNERKNRFFASYMMKARQDMTITVNREALQRIVGS